MSKVPGNNCLINSMASYIHVHLMLCLVIQCMSKAKNHQCVFQIIKVGLRLLDFPGHLGFGENLRVLNCKFQTFELIKSWRRRYWGLKVQAGETFLQVSHTQWYFENYIYIFIENFFSLLSKGMLQRYEMCIVLF